MTSAGLSGARDPEDTVVVTGGPAVADTGVVRQAAARVTAAADALRAASRYTVGAGARLAILPNGAVPAEVSAPVGASAMPVVVDGVCVPGPDALAGVSAQLSAGEIAARRAVIAAVESVTAVLRARAEACDHLGERLLRAAGLYETAEGVVERLLGGLILAEGFVLGTLLGSAPVLELVRSAYQVVAPTAPGRWAGTRLGLTPDGRPAGGGGAEDDDGGHAAGGRHRDAGGPGGGSSVVRGIAPWTDEFVQGLGNGLAWSAGSGGGVPGAAALLADAARRVSGVGEAVRLRPVADRDFAAGPPRWRHSGAATAGEALSRVDDLYPGRGAPEATVAVQRITGENGSTSWVVLVPGTQSAMPSDHPWDGLTDAELMAGRPDHATEAVRSAMSRAGVGAAEPVVLVGHSLGGIAATALASSPDFAGRYRIGGVVTAGSPVATFRTPPGVPVLHLETAEEVVSSLEGRSSAENPRTPDRVTVGRTLGASSVEADRAASGDPAAAHALRTHARTLELARASGDARAAAVVGRIEPLLNGRHVETFFYRAERAPGDPPGGDDPLTGTAGLSRRDVGPG